MSLEGSESVFATVFKTLEDGNSAILRLRSNADADEKLVLNWESAIPSSVSVFDPGSNQVIEEIGTELTVPARDFISLKVVW